LSKGFDCASPLTAETAAAFKANGYEFVIRYLVPTRYAKALTKDEADIIQAAGLKIVSIYETTANRSLDGHAAGLEDGATAAQCAAAVGQPEGTCIYFNAADFDPNADQIPTIIDYIHGCNEATPSYSTGDYGPYNVVTAVKNAGAASHGFQTYAWSSGKRADCQIYQWQNGDQYDEDESFGCEGWWGTEPASLPATVATKLDPGVALTWINTWGIPSWNAAIAAVDKEQADYIHWLCNMLREASGLPLE
jgi:hypothetical protein